MAKLVTKFRYYKPGGRKKIGGYAKYIALREGVEKCDDSKKYAPVSYNQKQLIQKILKDFPDSKAVSYTHLIGRRRGATQDSAECKSQKQDAGKLQ